MCPQTAAQLHESIASLSADRATSGALDNRTTPFYSAMLNVFREGDFLMKDVGEALCFQGKMLGFDEVSHTVLEREDTDDGHSMLEAEFSKRGYEELTINLRLTIPGRSAADEKISVVVNESDPQVFERLDKAAYYMAQLLGVTVYSGIS